MEINIPLHIMDKASRKIRAESKAYSDSLKLHQKNHNRRLANRKLREALLTDENKKVEC